MRIKTPGDFEWQKQARFYYFEDTDDCLVSITDVDFIYQVHNKSFKSCTADNQLIKKKRLVKDAGLVINVLVSVCKDARRTAVPRYHTPQVVSLHSFQSYTCIVLYCMTSWFPQLHVYGAYLRGVLKVTLICVLVII